MDLETPALHALLAKGRKTGKVTHDELNDALPEGQMNIEQIEDVMARLNEMGINVVEK